MRGLLDQWRMNGVEIGMPFQGAEARGGWSVGAPHVYYGLGLRPEVREQGTRRREEKVRVRADYLPILLSSHPPIQPQSSSSSFAGCAKTKAARLGAGIGLSGPRTERQMISFSSRSSAASSFLKFIRRERRLPQAVLRFFSFRFTLAGSAW